MNRERWQQVDSILKRTLRLEPSNRMAFLQQQCGDDHELHTELLSLLRYESDEDSDAVPAHAPGHRLRRDHLQANAPITLHPGDPFERYQIIEFLGAGGMGIVYLAEQQSPQRRVAIKLMANMRRSEDALRRFRLESEALARLDHPGIARVLESGTAKVNDSEVPFLAMEYVSGETLDRFVLRNNLELRERISLGAAICDAVQHAHQNGVIHRDLKPQNILVDTHGHPHIIDFGLARIQEDHSSSLTLSGEVLGTIGYMSPEQLKGDRSRVDARTDVYTLGVILYQIFACQCPFPTQESPLLETARKICETDAEPLGKIVASCRGDLEIIVEHAMDKNPDRRYSTAAELAADLRRTLKHEAISARPTSAFYQLTRWSQRNRGLVTSAAAVVVVLAVATFLVFLNQRERLRNQESSLRFFNTLLSPKHNWQREMTYADLLELAAAEVDQTYPDDLQVQADLHERLGIAFWGLSRYDESLRQLHLAETRLRSLCADMSPRLLRIANITGDVLRDAGRFEEATTLSALWLQRCRQQLGENHESTLRFAANHAESLATSGLEEAATRCYLELIPRVRETLTDTHPDKPEILNSYAKLLLSRHEYTAARTLAHEAWQLQLLAQGETNTATLGARTTLAQACLGLEQLSNAEDHLVAVVGTAHATCGARHLVTIEADFQMAQLLQKQGEEGPARVLFQRCHESAEQVLPEGNWRRSRYVRAEQ